MISRSILTVICLTLTALAVMPAVHAQDTDTAFGDDAPFVTTWKTDVPGARNDSEIIIPVSGSGYDFIVDWGDGTTTSWQDGDDPADLLHTFKEPSTYTVQITGDFPRTSFSFGSQLLTIEQWGDIEWSSMKEAFYDAWNLQSNATDTPDVSAVTDMWGTFWYASAFDQDLGDWDVSNVTDMEFMLTNSGLSTANYDATLTGWAGQPVQSGVKLEAEGLTYCVATDARQSLIDDHDWTIEGDSHDCSDADEAALEQRPTSQEH